MGSFVDVSNRHTCVTDFRFHEHRRARPRRAAVHLYWDDDRAKRDVTVTGDRSDGAWTRAKDHVGPGQRRSERSQAERQQNPTEVQNERVRG